MKKIICLVILLTLCGCSSNKISKDNLSGKYHNVGVLAIANWEYDLKSNETFDVSFMSSGTNYRKGTWSISDDKKAFYLDCKDMSSDGIDGKYAIYGDYYYKLDRDFAFWYLDDEYGTTIQFDNNGRTEQRFQSNYFSYGKEPNYRWYCVNLYLHDDGTCTVYKYVRGTGYGASDEETYKGKYSINDKKDILTLTFDGVDHICIIIDSKIYYSVLQKVE